MLSVDSIKCYLGNIKWVVIDVELVLFFINMEMKKCIVSKWEDFENGDVVFVEI